MIKKNILMYAGAAILLIVLFFSFFSGGIIDVGNGIAVLLSLVLILSAININYQAQILKTLKSMQNRTDSEDDLQ